MTSIKSGALARAVITLSLNACVCMAVQAQTSHEFIAPAPLKQDGRFMPGFGSEAIVRARYTVKADGTTADVELLGPMGNQFLDQMLTRNIAAWTFTPGTVDGAAADFHNQEIVMAFRVDPNAPPMAMGGPPAGGRSSGSRSGPPPKAPAPAPEAAAPAFVDPALQPPIPLGLTPAVKEQVDAISALLAAKDYKKALSEIDKALRRDVGTVFDYSLLNELKTTALMASNEAFAALESSKLSTLSSINARGEEEFFLTDDILRSALYKRFVLAMAVSQNQLALDTYELLQARVPMPADDKIHEQVKAVIAALESPEPRALRAQIVEDRWTFTPARRIFTVANVEGKLDRINARCQRRDLELEYQPDVDWTLPDTLGSCELDFEGRDGTSFVVYEFVE
jgi:hypothetical protein